MTGGYKLESTNEKNVGDMSEAEWQEHLDELVTKQVEYEMAQESTAILGFIGAIILHFIGFSLIGLIAALIGGFLFYRLVSEFLKGGRSMWLLLSLAISTLITCWAIFRLISRLL